MDIKALSVRQLNLYVKSLLEGDVRLENVTVIGEISNFKNHYSSGHFYFTLKDNEASIRCVMFRSYASTVKFVPNDGLQVIVRGRVSLYEKDGQYQFYVEDMKTVGLGDISLQFEQIKDKLSQEGLFDAQNKRKLPKYPKKIAIVTSKTGAAVQDMINIISRRWPVCEIIMCPVSVQGQLAVPDMLNTLDRIYSLSVADLIIIGRGGGSIEDLWAFNSEELARKIYESPVPVISAVGHETDFTICDFVADLRAPTPSAAAELAVPDILEVSDRINKFNSALKMSLTGKYNAYKARLEVLSTFAVFKRPIDCIVNTRLQYSDSLYDKITNTFNNVYKDFESRISSSIIKLDTLSPLKVLARGYSLAVKDDLIIKSVNDVTANDRFLLKLTDGTISCTVNEKENIG